MLAAAPEAPWDPSPSPTTNRGAAWRGIWASAVREARFIAEASIGGRLHLRPGPAPLQLEPGGIPQPRGQCLRNRGPGAGAGGRRAGRPGQGAGTRSQLPGLRTPGRNAAQDGALEQGPRRPPWRSFSECERWRGPGAGSLAPAHTPLAAHLSGAPRRLPNLAAARVRFPRAAAANAAPAAAARAGPLPRCRGSPGPWPRLRRPWLPPAGDAGSRGGNFGSPPPSSFARGRRSPSRARPPARLPRALTLAPRTRPPPAPHRHAHGARRPPPLPEAAARRPGRARPVPSRPCRAPLFSGQRPGAQRGGAEGRAGGLASVGRWRRGDLGKAARSLRPADPGAQGAGRGAPARGSGGPGGSPTRGSCCLNAGALPSRRLPRRAQPWPPGAPVPCVPGRCSLPRERRDWSARAEPPSSTASAAAQVTAEAPGRGKCVLSIGNVC